MAFPNLHEKTHFLHTLGTGIFFIKSSKILYMFMEAGLAVASLESRCRASSIRPWSTKMSTYKKPLSISSMLGKIRDHPEKGAEGHFNL